MLGTAAPICRRVMSTASSSLNRAIFNPALYRQVQAVWFEGHALGKQDLDERVMKRWFQAPPEEAKAFDHKCRSTFAHALEAIGPDKFPNPTAEPFVHHIFEATQKSVADDGADAAWTALSILLLLDQISRNVYRTNDGLKKVYGHFDKIAQDLVRTLLSTKSPVIRPDLHPQWRRSLAHRQWFYKPLMHSEDIAAHKQFQDIFAEIKREMDQGDGFAGQRMFLDAGLKAEKEHIDIIEKFGRYPHRNKPLGRQSTPEEVVFLEDGGATFGVGQGNK